MAKPRVYGVDSLAARKMVKELLSLGFSINVISKKCGLGFDTIKRVLSYTDEDKYILKNTYLKIKKTYKNEGLEYKQGGYIESFIYTKNLLMLMSITPKAHVSKLHSLGFSEWEIARIKK